MHRDAFIKSIAGNEPADGISVYLEALWYDAKGDWDKAHRTIQDVEDGDAAWIHAYLHRKEGDTSNADYWYRQAAKERSTASLEEEWKELVNAFSD